MGRKLSILVSENNAGSIFKNIKKVLTQRQTRELEPNTTQNKQKWTLTDVGRRRLFKVCKGLGKKTSNELVSELDETTLEGYLGYWLISKLLSKKIKSRGL